MHLAISSLTAEQVLFTLISIGVLYTIFVIIEMWLMQHFARKGPSGSGYLDDDAESDYPISTPAREA